MNPTASASLPVLGASATALRRRRKSPWMHVRDRHLGGETHSLEQRGVGEIVHVSRDLTPINCAHDDAGCAAALDPAIFRLPVERIRDGYYSDAYFVYTKQLLEARGPSPPGDDAGVPETRLRARRRRRGDRRAEDVLRGDEAADGEWIPGWGELDVHALHEGDRIAPWETVMTIEGDYGLFAHLETVYLGCMARRSLIMRNVAEVVEAARGKPIFYFPARHDHWLVQTGDGWSAHVAGAIGVSTDAQASWWGGRGIGTVPHGLIAAYGGRHGRRPRRPSPTTSTRR